MNQIIVLLIFIHLCITCKEQSNSRREESTTTSSKKKSAKTSTQTLTSTSSADITLSLGSLPQSNQSSLNVTITGVTKYQYKLGLADSTDCHNDTGYSAEVSAVTPITDSLSSFSNSSELRLCVLGIDASGNKQALNKTSEYTWTYSVSLTVEPRYAAAPNWNDYVSVSNNENACDTAVSKNCIHGGDARKVITPASSCTGLNMTDALGAMVWSCQIVSGKAVFYSRLKSAKGLQDLVNHGSPNGSWKLNNVSLSGLGSGSIESSSDSWWTNSIAPLPDSSASALTISSASSGTIFTVNTNASTKGIIITTNKVAVVLMNSTIMQFTGTASEIVKGYGYFYHWFEGGKWTMTTSPSQVFNLGGITMLRNLDSESGASIGAYSEEHGIHMSGTKIVGSFASALFSGCSYCRFTNVKMKGGFLIDQGDFTVVDGMYVSDYSINRGAGFQNLNDLVVQNLMVAGTTSSGINFNTVNRISAQNLLGAHSTNSAVYTTDVSDATIDNVLVVNNNYGLYINTGVTNFQVRNIVAAANVYGLQTANDQTVTLGGLLILGGNTTRNCNVSGSGSINISFGTANATCAATGGLTEISYNANFTNTFVGKVSVDSTNTSSSGTGTASFAALTDWTRFDRALRFFGPGSASAYLNSNQRGNCSSGTCQIYDLALASTDTLLRNKSGNGTTANDDFTATANCPSQVAGNVSTTTHSGATYLKNATEILSGDLMSENGDHDGFCETNETCLYRPNFGLYQGHGSLGTCIFQANGGLSGITMYGYSNNSGY